MQRIQKLMLLQRQATTFLNCAGRALSGPPILTCAEEKPVEPLSLFLCDHQGIVPISEDADKIYEDNKSAIEHRVTRQLLPAPTEFRTKAESSSQANYMSDTNGLISSQCVKLSMAEKIKSSHTATMSRGDVLSTDILLASPLSNDEQDNEPPVKEDGNSNLPSQQQLEKVKAHIIEHLPKFFKSTMHHYSVYTPDVIFENNYWGSNKIYHGISRYGLEMMRLRFRGLLMYADINMYIMNITTHPEDGTIKVRWTMKGISQLRALKFWKWNFLNLSRKTGIVAKAREDFITHDGFNIFWVNKDGYIYRNRLDKLMPDEERKVMSSPVKQITKLINTRLEGAGAAASSDVKLFDSSTDHQCHSEIMTSDKLS